MRASPSGPHVPRLDDLAPLVGVVRSLRRLRRALGSSGPGGLAAERVLDLAEDGNGIVGRRVVGDGRHDAGRWVEAAW